MHLGDAVKRLAIPSITEVVEPCRWLLVHHPVVLALDEVE